MKVLIVANGESPSATVAEEAARNSDLIVATDGGVFAAAKLKLLPDILTGDMDSVLVDNALELFPKLRVIPTPDQDYSDLEKAVDIASQFGATSIVVIGATGRRPDHTLANLALLRTLSSSFDIKFADNYGDTWHIGAALDSEAPESCIEISTDLGDTISLIATDVSTVVSVEGVQWDLENFELIPGTHGVSNVATGRSVLVKVTRGSLYVCRLRLDILDTME